MNTWLQRVVVRGPAKEVIAFSRNAGTRDKAHYVYERAHLRTQRLSFIKLYDSLPVKLARKVSIEKDGMQEPFDLSIEPIRKFRDGTAVVTYRFQLSAMEPENFVTVLSELYASLCFLVGMVDPNTGTAGSILAHRGKASRWQLPVRRIEAIYPSNPDADFWDLVECDRKAMDEVLDHWKAKAKAIAEEMVRTAPSQQGKRRHPARKSVGAK
jgi:hypothetical protein